MDRLNELSREQLEKMNGILIDMCLHFCGTQYTESILRSRGFSDRELEAVGFDVDSEWSDMDACVEV